MTAAALWTLVFVPLWLVLFVRFARTQGQALCWIDEHVGPRFRRRLTAWSRGAARAHLLLLAALAAMLVAAATGPGWLTGEAKTKNSGRLLLALDASASMIAADVKLRGQEEFAGRLVVAKYLAAGLAKELDGWDIAVASWSGVATVHTPLQKDATVTGDAVDGLRHHSLYRSTGSSFGSILDVALRFHDPDENALQVVLISDGEMPRPELYDEALAALAEAGVVVHTVGVGGTSPVSMSVWDPKDLGKPEDERGVIKEFQTARVDEHLRRIAGDTGGRFVVPDLEGIEGGDGPVAELATRMADWLRNTEVDAGAEQRERARRDLTAWLLGAALLGVLLDLHVLWRGRGGTPTFRLDAIGRQPKGAGQSAQATTRGTAARGTAAISLLALVALLPMSCGRGVLWEALGGPVWDAHRANQKGIHQTVLGRHDSAEVHFLRSTAFGVDPEIPTYNHARSQALDEDLARAHELNEKALELSPRHDAARFNDGVVLYRWGVVEAHPQGCELDRTLDLWDSALRRFNDVAESADDPDLRQRAKEQAEHVRREKARLEQLVIDPPDCCEDESESESESESENESEGGGGSGRGGEPPPSEPPPPEPPPSDPPPGEPPPGQGEPPQGEGESPQGGGGLSESEVQEILAELERIRGQAVGEGKFHFRSAAEQVDEESFWDPEEVWW